MSHSTAKDRPGYEYREVPQYQSRWSRHYVDPVTRPPTTPRSQPRTSRPTPNNPPLRKAPPTTKLPATMADVKVLHIPSNSIQVELWTLPLLPIEAQCNVLEKQLQWVPNFRDVNIKSFQWQQRSLIKLTAEELGPQWKEDYFMYKCEGSRVRLNPNISFPGAHVYGDVFVFRMVPDSYIVEPSNSTGKSDEYTQLPEYVNMDMRFAMDVEEKLGAFQVVQRLAEE